MSAFQRLRVRMYLPLSFFLVAVLVVLRSVTGMSPEAAAFVFGFVTWFGCLGLAADASGKVLARWLGRRPTWWGIGILNVGAPGVFGAYRTLSGDEPLFWGLGTIVLTTALGGLIVAQASRRATVESPRVTLCWSALTLGLFLYVHGQTGTLFAIREGTERLHLLLFFGTWIFGMVLPLGAYFRESRAAVAKPPRVWLCLVSLVLFGLGALEADGRAFVDSYPAVHVWLGVSGIFAAAQGIALLLEALVPTGRGLIVGERISLIFLGTCAIILTLVGPKLARGVVRSKIAHEPLGMSLLELMPKPDIGETTHTYHPALTFEQHLTAPPLETKPNVLLITVDALRADALSHMPKFGRRLSSCAVFERAYAQGTRTAIGMGTLMTGRYSANIDWDLWSYSRGRISPFSSLSKEERSDLGKRATFTTVPRVASGGMLAERLRSVGYSTSAVPYAGVNDFFRPDLAFARGFTDFVDLTERKWKPPTSKRVMKLSLAQLQSAKTPWFHWVHLYDPHEAKRSKKRYNSYVRAVDSALEGTLGKLRDQLSETAIVLLADHGEAFGEHRHHSHGTSLYDEQALVPFVLCLPGVEGKRLVEPVAAIDATATLLAMTGAPTQDLDGINLLPLLKGTAPSSKRPIFTELHRYMSSKGAPTTDLKGVIFEGYKLILDRRRGTEEFYDLRADPGETHNLAGEDSAEQSRLREILLSFLAKAESRHPLPDVSKSGSD